MAILPTVASRTRGAGSEPAWVENRPTRTRLERGVLWRNRELVWLLVLRDVKVRYKQAALGVAWALLQPLAVTAVFTVVFHNLARVPSDGVPYPLFALVGLAVWTYLATNLIKASHSLVDQPVLVTKLYLPRLAVPFASVLSGLADLAVTVLLVLLLLPSYGVG
jgi:ABC-type polysaccharide/polyol phosphate export systems, permease component